MGLFGSLKHLADPFGIAKDKNLADPLGLSGGPSIFSSTPGAPAAAAPGIDPNMQGGYAGGDSSDPTYGSLTKPFGVEEFYNYADPGYAFQLQQGNQALQNSASAGSGAMSGSALKDLLKYNQDYAGTAYNDAFNRYQTQQGNIFSRLSSIASLGQNAAAGVGNNGVGLAGQAGQAITNAGTAQGAGAVGAGNALSGGLTNYWLMNQLSQKPVGGGNQFTGGIGP